MSLWDWEEEDCALTIACAIVVAMVAIIGASQEGG
jgi:hypothetical protein